MLELKIHEKNVEIVKYEEYVRGTVGTKCKITFDTFWQDYEKTVVFKRCDFSISPIRVLVNEMEITPEIPPEVLAGIGSFMVGVYGITEDSKLPTLYSEKINVVYGTDTACSDPAQYTPNAIDQLRLQKQDKLTPGKGIIIDANNVISTDETIDKGTLKNKVDKIDYTKKEQADDGDWGYDTGVYGVKGNNNPALFHATKAATANTVAVRDNSGSIGVSINIKDANGNNYVGGAAPHTWVNAKFNEYNTRLYEFRNNEAGIREQADYNLQKQVDGLKTVDAELSKKIANGETELDLFKSVVDGKKITKYTIAAGGSLTLKKNAIYIFLRDGSSNTVSIYNNDAIQYKGTDNELTFETGIVIIPDNTMGSSVEYPPSYYSLAIKVKSGSSILGVPDVNSAKFSVLKEVMENGGLVAKESSGNSTFSVLYKG